MRFRPAAKYDFATCRTLLHPALGLDGRVLDRIVEIWADLAVFGTFAVVEDPSRPHPASIEGFGVSAFVSDGFAEQLIAERRHYLDAAFYDRILDGRSPLLSWAEIARANAGPGLTLLVLNFGLRNHDVTDAHTQRVLQVGSAAFYALHAGYRMRLVLNEVFGDDSARYMAAGGFRRILDGGHAEAGSRRDRPYVFAMRREWTEPAAVHPFSFLFHTPEPVIGFSPSEQRVLAHALMNQPDPEIAASLGLSVDAVKKTWRRVYERVSRQVPFLINEGDRSGRGERRMAEKRRYLVEYLRTHLEEVRPWASAKSANDERSKRNGKVAAV